MATWSLDDQIYKVKNTISKKVLCFFHYLHLLLGFILGVLNFLSFLGLGLFILESPFLTMMMIIVLL